MLSVGQSWTHGHTGETGLPEKLKPHNMVGARGLGGGDALRSLGGMAVAPATLMQPHLIGDGVRQWVSGVDAKAGNHPLVTALVL